MNNIESKILNVNYGDLLQEEVYKTAYMQIKSKPGNMTPATTKETLDGMSEEWIKKTVEAMRARRFRFEPARRVYIEKKDGSKRPLGIPNPRDKVVQKALLNLLEPEYEEKVFLPQSHGFRPHKGCQTAIESVRGWTGVTWMIEGDIKSYFDTIDHQILLDLIKSKLRDTNVVELIKRFLQAGYLETDGRKISTSDLNSMGVPQGGVLSPFLSNVYLHELDEFMAKLKQELDSKGAISVNSNAYQRAQYALKGAVASYRKSPSTEGLKKLRASRKLRSLTPSTVRTGCRVHYVRYADDWLIGVVGPYEIACEIKAKVAKFLTDRLKVTLNEEKTKITKVTRDPVYFLGFKLQATSYKNWESRRFKNSDGGISKKGAGLIRVYCPLGKVYEKLESEHMVAEKRGISKTSWTNLSDFEIVVKFRHILIGLYNYYYVVDNPYGLDQIRYWIQFSAAHTLAHKHKTSVSKVFLKYGKELTVTWEQASTLGASSDSNQERVRELTATVTRKVSLALPEKFKSSAAMRELKTSKKSRAQKTSNSTQQYDPFAIMPFSTRSHFVFDKVCSLCGSASQIEMHHVKHLKNIKGKKDAASLKQISLNRKQIAVCRVCHLKIHGGQHDSTKL